MDINVLAESQECPGWTLECPLPGEPSFSAHVMGFSPQLLNSEQLLSPIFSSLFFYIWPRSPRSTSFLVVETRGLLRTAVPKQMPGKWWTFPILKFCSAFKSHLAILLLYFLINFKSFGFFFNPFSFFVSNHYCISHCSYLLCLMQYLRISEIHNLKIISIKKLRNMKAVACSCKHEDDLQVWAAVWEI